MTAHELARLLLQGEDAPVMIWSERGTWDYPKQVVVRPAGVYFDTEQIISPGKVLLIR
jgi:hypothetical protein